MSNIQGISQVAMMSGQSTVVGEARCKAQFESVRRSLAFRLYQANNYRPKSESLFRRSIIGQEHETVSTSRSRPILRRALSGARVSFNRPFPLEIHERIIEIIGERGDTQSGRKDLRACALTHPGWLKYSRKGLYHTVTLKDARTLRLFACTVRSPSCKLGDLVRVLCVAADKRQMGHLSVQSIVSFPTVLLGQLPKLSYIRILGVWPSTVVLLFHPTYARCLKEFSSVNTLKVTDVTFQSFSDFTRAVSAVPQLTSLECKRLHWKQCGSSRRAVLSRSLRLKTLLVEWCPPKNILEWFGAMQQADCLEALSLPVLSEEEVELVQSILAVSRLSLQHLALGFGAPKTARSIDLGCLESLQSVRLHIARQWGWVPETVETICPTSLRYIVLLAGPSLTKSGIELHHVQCKRLDDYLSTAALEAVRLVFAVSSNISTTSEGSRRHSSATWEGWPMCEARFTLTNTRGAMQLYRYEDWFDPRYPCPDQSPHQPLS